MTPAVPRSSSTASRSRIEAARRRSRTSPCASSRARFSAIAGPNGGGKTTLLRLALGLERPVSGTVRVFGLDPGARGAPRVCVRRPARPAGHRDARHGAGDRGDGAACRPRPCRPASCRRSPRCGAGDRPRRPRGSRGRAVAHALRRHAAAGLHRAGALAAEPALLALDEPTTGVDATAQESLAQLLSDLRDELGVTILYVSHEFGAVEHVVSRLVLIRGRHRVRRRLRPPCPAMWHDPSHAH